MSPSSVGSPNWGSDRKPKLAIATMWSIAVFLFAFLADMCFQHWSLYVFGIASVLFAVVSAVFSINLLGIILGLIDQ